MSYYEDDDGPDRVNLMSTVARSMGIMVDVDAPLANQFCPTGPGGGVDATCGSSGELSGGALAAYNARIAAGGTHAEAMASGRAAQPTKPPCCPAETRPDATHARVGVPAGSVPPPGEIPRLPNLTARQRDVETRFAEAYLKDPDGMVDRYLGALADRKVGEYPNVFATDDVKALNPDWNPAGATGDEQKAAMAEHNTAVHATANAITKRAFLKHLDGLAKLPEDDERRSVLATNGGCAGGKGSTLAGTTDPANPHFGMLPDPKRVGAIWDAAGEQNATENGWIARECEKRGLKATFAYISADPKGTWDAKDRGVIRRAMRKGRMVDARLFADSYAEGAKNFHSFWEAQQGGPHSFVFIDNRVKSNPKVLDRFPKRDLKLDAEDIYADAVKVLKARSGDLSPVLVRAGLAGSTIWGPPKGRTDNAKDAKGHGSNKRQCGFDLVPGVKSVRKHEDHEFNGTKVVTLDNGDEHHIYFDRQSGMYYHESPVEQRKSHGSGILATSKDEVLPSLVARQSEFKPVARIENASDDDDLDDELDEREAERARKLRTGDQFRTGRALPPDPDADLPAEPPTENINDEDFEQDVRAACRKLNTDPGRMPGYGSCWIKGRDVWYIGEDGDEREFGRKVKPAFLAAGAEDVRYEAEYSPDNVEKHGVWKQVCENDEQDRATENRVRWLPVGTPFTPDLREAVAWCQARNAEQERDELGRWVTMYHGTSPEKAAKIRADGMLKAGGGIVGTDIYLTKNPEYAKFYGPDVFAVRVPEDKLERVAFDEGLEGGDALDDDDREMIEYAAEYTYKGATLPIHSDEYQVKKVGEADGVKPNGRPHEKHAVYQDGEKVGEVRSVTGYKDTKAKGTRSVARKAVVKWVAQPEHDAEGGKTLEGPSVRSEHYTDKQGAVDHIKRAHERYLKAGTNNTWVIAELELPKESLVYTLNAAVDPKYVTALLSEGGTVRVYAPVRNDATAEWDEAKHKRDKGKFTSGGGSPGAVHGHDDAHSHGHGPEHELEHAAHQAHLLHEGHEVAEVLAGGHEAAHAAVDAAHSAHDFHDAHDAGGHAHTPADAGAIIASHIYGPALKSVAAIFKAVPGARKVGEAISRMHEGTGKMADAMIAKGIERYGKATMAAMMGTGSLTIGMTHAAAGIPGVVTKSLPAKGLIGALPFLALAEAGKRAGLVGANSKLEAGLVRAGSWIHAIKSVAGKAAGAATSVAAKAGLAVAKLAGRGVGKLIGNEQDGWIVVNERGEQMAEAGWRNVGFDRWVLVGNDGRVVTA